MRDDSRHKTAVDKQDQSEVRDMKYDYKDMAADDMQKRITELEAENVQLTDALKKISNQRIFTTHETTLPTKAAQIAKEALAHKEEKPNEECR
jgi:hypothetical protein